MKLSVQYGLKSAAGNLAALAVLCALAGGALLQARGRPALAVGKQIAVFAAKVAEASEKVNPNSASAASLRRLPGIGPARARAIVAYRQAREAAAFRSADDLDDISGIGPITVARLADLLTLPRHPTPSTAPAGGPLNRQPRRP